MQQVIFKLIRASMSTSDVLSGVPRYIHMGQARQGERLVPRIPKHQGSRCYSQGSARGKVGCVQIKSQVYCTPVDQSHVALGVVWCSGDGSALLWCFTETRDAHTPPSVTDTLIITEQCQSIFPVMYFDSC